MVISETAIASTGRSNVVQVILREEHCRGLLKTGLKACAKEAERVARMTAWENENMVGKKLIVNEL
jgi:hypothetical protein